MRKALTFFLVFVMGLSMSTSVFASEFSDMPQDWSTVALEKAIVEELLVETNGEVRPKDYLTRAEMAAAVNRAFGATQKASLSSYTDIANNDWYYDEMAKAVYMKTFVGSQNEL